MNRSRATAALAATVLLAGLSACSDDSSSTPSADRTPSTSATGADALPTPEGDDVDPAISEPVEDSVYPDAGDPSVDALSYRLGLTWDPDGRVLTGDETVWFRSTGTADHVQLDLAEQLEVSSVQVDGTDAEFEHEGKDLVVSGDFVADQRYELSLDYSGTPEPVPAPTTRKDFDTSGFTISGDGSAWTMQEPYGAYTWYAVNDQPADKAFYGFILTAPEPMTGVANGTMVNHEVDDGTTQTVWMLDHPTSSYLVTVAFGDYEVTEDESASGVPLSYWIPTSASERLDDVRYTREALAWVEGKLGPYPWTSLGVLVVDSTSGMETQTMITLGNNPYTTDPRVIVHEIVHQWYGDRVTPSDWSDLWMNEGMAMYLQLLWQSEDTDTPLEELLREVVPTERRSRRINGPPADYDPRTFAEIQVYYGPALMWDQIRQRVGDEKFWEMVRAWPTHDPDGSSNRDEYLAWVEEETGAELSDLFDGWLLAKRSPKFTTAG